MFHAFDIVTRDEASCLSCEEKRNIIKGLPLCLACATELVNSGLHTTTMLCPKCLFRMHPKKGCVYCKSDNSKILGNIYAPYLYRGVVRNLLLGYKFKGYTNICALFAENMLSCVSDKHFDMVVPIPLHPRRYIERGYNQAELLANPIAGAMHIPLENVLVRLRYTRKQTTLKSAKERKENVNNAFALNERCDVKNKDILLVDDVRTSGATALSCAKVLIEKGAHSVSLLVCAVPQHTLKRYVRRQ